MQASRRSVKTHQGVGSIGSSLSTGFQVQHVDRVTTSLRVGFWVPILPLLALDSVYVGQGSTIRFIGS